MEKEEKSKSNKTEYIVCIALYGFAILNSVIFYFTDTVIIKRQNAILKEAIAISYLFMLFSLPTFFAWRIKREERIQNRMPSSYFEKTLLIIGIFLITVAILLLFLN